MHNLELHIGIYVGEVVFEQGDVLGDRLNIARLQFLTPRGDVLFSKAVYPNIQNKQEFNVEFYQEERLKNVVAKLKKLTALE